MGVIDSNARTHEPGLRELVAQIDGMIRLYEERDRRYEDRFKAQETAVAAALAAQEKLTAAAFAAAKEAVLKQENSQSSYNATHNDLTRKMDNQYALMLPRTEADSRARGSDEKIEDIKKGLAGLRESRSESSGRRQQTDWFLTGLLSIAGIVIGYISGLFRGAR